LRHLGTVQTANFRGFRDFGRFFYFARDLGDPFPEDPHRDFRNVVRIFGGLVKVGLE